jgi:hypothetical protein
MKRYLKFIRYKGWRYEFNRYELDDNDISTVIAVKNKIKNKSAQQILEEA